jgi:hypothetical protein
VLKSAVNVSYDKKVRKGHLINGKPIINVVVHHKYTIRPLTVLVPTEQNRRGALSRFCSRGCLTFLVGLCVRQILPAIREGLCICR